MAKKKSKTQKYKKNIKKKQQKAQTAKNTNNKQINNNQQSKKTTQPVKNKQVVPKNEVKYNVVLNNETAKKDKPVQKTINKETFEKACAIFFVMLTISYISLAIIMCNINSNITALDAFFDIASSIATVGLSTGAIANMNELGIINIMLLMYIGRVGTITTAVAFVIGRPKENDDIVYAKEDVIVG